VPDFIEECAKPKGKPESTVKYNVRGTKTLEENDPDDRGER